MIYDITKLIKNKYFEELKDYSPYIRQAMLFKYVTEEMPLKITDTDYIAGYYGYENSSNIAVVGNKSFESKKVLNSTQKQLLEHLQNNLKIEINFTLAHTCIDYGNILENGLTHYISLVEDRKSVV